MSDSEFDVIVFGATSFVGQIVCEYLHGEYQDSKLRWAAAGRSESKLRELQQRLGANDDTMPLRIADASDDAALNALCRQTRVMISTVGPYALYGEPMVKACVETGTDYCDLTGETQWIARMVKAYEKQAQQTGARIVHCCGFDSIPSDLGVHFLQENAKADFNGPCTTVTMRVKAMRGSFSGGTIASLMNVIREASKDPSLRKSLANPYAICPEHFQPKTRQHNVNGAEFDADFNAWTAPFVMAAINTRVVHRSHALAGAPWGEGFRYDEAMLTGKGMKGRLAALATAGGLGGLMIGGALAPTRWVLERFVLPKPGEGPSKDEQLNGFFDLRFRGTTERGESLSVKVTGDRDPGYGSTAKMLSQAAICLGETSRDQRAGGFWTPSTAMGNALIERLREHAGLTFERLSN
ncbi:short subunit dehydrogenase-like uncharacterized protein [Litorivivens lipolytica]|uniref:Short subunit dehydrogenase-like uncharacterized protein n=1 Tax=Litorivivens lipolytica TaxID=1524264 RepID=A0A7W4W4Y5_9GAMM|nr:saccharopine dehydrogenase NADP-binding domain-containing protein [Litorivivens lipolytica]MBB3047530.1 short subunit dehydrogenase-like uncharacterized protein [Litorivivens lipolytica]